MGAAEDILDIGGIDALLERFRSRRVAQRHLAEASQSFAVETPTTLRPEVLRATRLRYDKIEDRLAHELSGVLRTRAEIEITLHQQERLGAILMRLPRPGVTFRVDVQELGQPALFWMPAGTVSSMVDLLVGGVGVDSTFDRPLTLIERRILDDLLQPIQQSHARILSAIAPLSFDVAASYHRPEELAPVAHAETYLVTEYVIRVGKELSWSLSFGLPVGELVDALESCATLPIQSEESSGDRRRALELSLSGVQVQTSVEIGSTQLSLSDVTALEPGDVVVLDRKRGESFDFRVEGVGKYRGRLGRAGKMLAFSVDRAIEAVNSQDEVARR
ncbi:MAG: FliM/FliN family flagellar motor switch protein [Planctomycetota bacterium]